MPFLRFIVLVWLCWAGGLSAHSGRATACRPELTANSAVTATNGAVAARYEYGPFGEPLRASGPAARMNPFRFSTQFTYADTGLSYYGYRYYNPSTGGWVNRDPLGLAGGLNLYAAMLNRPTILFDRNGLDNQYANADPYASLTYNNNIVNVRGTQFPVYTPTAYDLTRDSASQRNQLAQPAGFGSPDPGIPVVLGAYEDSGRDFQKIEYLGDDPFIELLFNKENLESLAFALATEGIGPVYRILRFGACGPTGRVLSRNLPRLRQRYVDEVAELKDLGNTVRTAGSSPEDTARMLHRMRRELGIQYKQLTPPDKLAEITARNTRKYGDPLGPSVDWLRARGKSWQEIIESASRSGGADLGL